MFSLVAALVAVALAEVVLRLCVTRSKESWGRVFGVELPPFEVLPHRLIPSEERRRQSHDRPWKDLVVDGVAVTHSDIRGIMREDAELGHAPQESSASTNRWFVTNSLGAIGEREVEPRRSGPRVLAFGDSFTQCSRLPWTLSWPARLDARSERVEVQNFGVEGYGMGQALLRYRQLAPRLDHDFVVLMFVPYVDLWRDVNVSRYLGERWRAFRLNPRFVLREDRLVAIKSPYASLRDQVAANPKSVSPKLRGHLREYDAFYVPALYEGGAWDSLVLGRLLATAVLPSFKAVQKRTRQPVSDAMVLVRRILEQMRIDVAANGAEFHVILLPTLRVVEKVASDASYRSDRERMVAWFAAGDYPCHDLLPALAAAESLDHGYDGTHYGLRANQVIADAIWAELGSAMVR